MNLNHTFFIASIGVILSVNTINCAPHIEHDTVLTNRSFSCVDQKDSVTTIQPKYTKSGFRDNEDCAFVESSNVTDSLPVPTPAASEVAPVSVMKVVDTRSDTSPKQKKPKYTKSDFRENADCVFVESSNATDSLYHVEEVAAQAQKRTWFQYIGNKSSESWTCVRKTATKAFNSALIIVSKISQNIFGYTSTTTWF